MKLYIKNMVSNRCIIMVKEELKKLCLHFSIVGLGEVEIMEDISNEQRERLKTNLAYSGLELMDDKRKVLMEKIKEVVIQTVLNTDETSKVNFSTFLSEKLHHSYTYLSNLFSELQGMSIQHFMMLLKVERVKELIIYDDLTISEIAYRMKYSSVAHLSNQFKKITGLSPSHFKLLKDKRRVPLEELRTQV